MLNLMRKHVVTVLLGVLFVAPPGTAKASGGPKDSTLTLHFVGETHGREVDGVIESVERSAAGVGAFDLAATRLITLPERGTARLVALETDAPPGLLEIHRRLIRRLARRPRDHERFLPHFTLCRFANDARPTKLDRPVSIPALPIDEVRLVRSVLRPGGAEHRPLAKFPLERARNG